MDVSAVVKRSFTVIGIEGSTSDGGGFIEKLWKEANSRFSEIMHLCKRDEEGDLVGFWGAMSDFSRSFQPWEGFSRGLYLAGAECEDEAEAPNGWVKWVIPAFEYLCFGCGTFDFGGAIGYLNDNGFSLAGAAHDFTDPRTGRSYMYLPIKRLN